jgi:16S rRNA (guanine966-N2)-methyltransferase
MSLRLSGGRRLQSPPGQSARPTPARVRLAVMNILAAELPGAQWLDLFSGSGVMACEALQRGAAGVVAIEQDRANAATCRANLAAVCQGLGRPCSAEVLQRDVLSWLRCPTRGEATAGSGGFDLIYADPPYRAELYGAIGAAIASGPWLKPGGLMLWECSSTAVPDIPSGWGLVKLKRYGSSSVLVLNKD